jgi:hypothetical protein
MGSSRLAVFRLLFLICIFECIAEREDQKSDLKEVKKLQVSGPDPNGTPQFDKVLCCCRRDNPRKCSKQFGVKGKRGNTEGKRAKRISCPLGFHSYTYSKYKKYHEGKNPCKGLPDPVHAGTDADADDADSDEDEDILSDDVDSEEKCNLRRFRFHKIGRQDQFVSGGDKFFPPAVLSISESGTCGDKAQNIQEDCSKFNQWNLMETISQNYGAEFAIMRSGTEGKVLDTDVKQGALGTCYFLAAISSIAYSRPELIMQMFPDGGIYTKGKSIKTRWLVNGEETFVQVDTTIPASPEKYKRDSITGQSRLSHRSKPYFAQVPWNRIGLHKYEGVWWGVILEKAWAKIFGSFKTAEGGFYSIAASAITGAPSTVHRSTEDEAYLWNALKEAAGNRWAIGATTQSSAPTFGLANGHVYSVFKAFEIEPRDGPLQRVLLVRNPWHKNHYNGTLAHHPAPGAGFFYMLFEEANVCFSKYAICKMEKDYKVHLQDGDVFNLNHGAEHCGTKTYEVTTKEKWYVSMVWPNRRMFCNNPAPAYVLAVRNTKTGEVFLPKTASRIPWGANHIDVELPGAGTYQIAFSVNFRQTTHLRHIRMNKYAHEDATFAEATDYQTYSEVIYDMLTDEKDCGKFQAKGMTWVKKGPTGLVNGVPALEGELMDPDTGHKPIMFWNYRRMAWVEPAMAGLDVAKGTYTHFYPPLTPRSDMQCVYRTR